MNPAGISLNHLTLGYAERILLQDVSVKLDAGEFCALIGRNGAGKSTLMRAISGIGRIESGSIEIAGSDISKMSVGQIARQVAFVSTERIRVTDLKVEDVVSLGRAPYTGWFGRLADEDRKTVAKALDAVGMSDFADKDMDSLSDGECQRVMIARALAQDTPVILLDEPTAFLDVPNRYETCLLLRKLARERNKTVLFSSHDISIVTRICDSAALIADRQLYHGPIRQLLQQGVMQKLFEGTPLTLDRETGNVDLSL